jgi:protein-disulfide isomerase
MLKRTLTLTLGILISFIAAYSFADTPTALFHSSNDPIGGNPRGTVTVVEFFDYQCAHCIDMAPVVSAIIRANPDVRYVFKEFPIRGPISELAARAALAANKQGRYLQMNKALFEADRPLNEESIMQAAQNAGLNMTQFKKDINSISVIHQVNSNLRLAQQLRLNFTPVFFFAKTRKEGNYNMIIGAISRSAMQNAINQAKG